MNETTKKHEGKYDDAQREWLKHYLTATISKYVSLSDIQIITKAFNNTFSCDRTNSAIAAQLRVIKTKLKLPIKIAYTGISWTTKRTKVTAEPVPDVRTISAVSGRISALLKELDLAFKEVVRQNAEMKQELRKLAEVRSAIDKYRNGR